ncbi:MAG: UDP-N-acetylmuramoyl-L-alanine--D-glutamate ligase, partial [Legionellaceae bacterium]|nr:UDP-N-acetylmuramoyl-L-alanine--D-glutamate ligase [Legionellaceae bacterium]
MEIRHLVIGLGQTGFSIAQFLHRRNLPFCVFDTRPAPPMLSAFQTAFPQQAIYTETMPDAVLDGISEVLVSPGISPQTPIMQEIARRQLPVYGDIECLARAVKAPIIGITGTNGKSTVTSLLGDMATLAGRRVAVGGNIGTPVLDLLEEEPPFDLWVLELSSFQLQYTSSLRCAAATILNVTEDHLDWHKDFAEYVAAKQRIYKGAQHVVYLETDKNTWPKSPEFSGKSIEFSLGSPAPGHWGILLHAGEPYLSYGDERLMPIADLNMQGTHNWLNALAAAGLASCVGIPKTCIVQALQQFEGLSHRCQVVRTLNGVVWIDDSKGTNVGATESALVGTGSGLSGKIVWIAGGLGKGADFTAIRKAVAAEVRTALLIGQDADKIYHAIQDLVP